jgi:SAM-dependent methyltransferase
VNAYSPKEYWAGLAAKERSDDARGFAPVLHPNAPAWFNQLIDEMQFRAIRRALKMAGVAAGARTLDVGCGTGRWVRRYEGMGLRVTGVDATAGMLKMARNRGTPSPLTGGEAFRLPFADGAFDLVSDVTVVQHIPAARQAEALGEMVRVLRPGGKMVLMELIRGEDAHIFPRKPRDWIEQVTSRGAKLRGWFGQEFLVFDRAFVAAARIVSGRAGENGSRRAGAGAAEGPPSAESKGSLAKRVYWRIRRVTAPFSAWTDPMMEKVCPAGLATHGVFVFQK